MVEDCSEDHVPSRLTTDQFTQHSSLSAGVSVVSEIGPQTVHVVECGGQERTNTVQLHQRQVIKLMTHNRTAASHSLYTHTLSATSHCQSHVQNI